MTYFVHYTLFTSVLEYFLSPRNDYGVRSLESILDMVKVMSFALKGGKVSAEPQKYFCDQSAKNFYCITFVPSSTGLLSPSINRQTHHTNGHMFHTLAMKT